MWGITLAQSAILQAAARAIRSDSLLLKVRAQETRGALRLYGGSSDPDAPEIAALIKEASLCAPCIAQKTGATRKRVDESLGAMAAALKIAQVARCDACLKHSVVYRLA
jgi:hypothetical protein